MRHVFCAAPQIRTPARLSQSRGTGGRRFLSRRASPGPVPSAGSGPYSYSRMSFNEPWSDEAKPVRIMRSAIDVNVPHANLYVTAAHALYIDGILVRAGDLINGTTITVDDADELYTIEYFHIMFDEHDVVDAEGAACESLLQRDVVIWIGNPVFHRERCPGRPGRTVRAAGELQWRLQRVPVEAS